MKYRGSTGLSLANLFKHPPRVYLSPDEGPYWPDKVIGMPLHFINCHGGDKDCRFYGEADDTSGVLDPYPVAHDSGCIAEKITPGTVAAVECCYGAQLYDPFETGGVVGICHTYLASGASAFFGASTAAYGGVDVNLCADLLCRYFLKHVLEGRSVGEATLLGRQAYVHDLAATDDPADAYTLKTLAQFNLMGDPSRHPFRPASPRGAGASRWLERWAEGRADRRASATTRGEELQRSTAVADSPVEVPDAEGTIARLLLIAGVTGWDRPELKSFVVPASESPVGETDAQASRVLIHVLTRRAKQEPARLTIAESIVAKEVDGQIMWTRLLSSR
jgi:hypothetical protein